MDSYIAPLEDIRFSMLAAGRGYDADDTDDAEAELRDSICAEAARLAQEVIAPLNSYW